MFSSLTILLLNNGKCRAWNRISFRGISSSEIRAVAGQNDKRQGAKTAKGLLDLMIHFPLVHPGALAFPALVLI